MQLQWVVGVALSWTSGEQSKLSPENALIVNQKIEAIPQMRPIITPASIISRQVG